ncbi:MAG: TolC family protein [Pirellulaceae bacterium]|nr:TolC family protein [Pirellulaceae bacterium]
MRNRIPLLHQVHLRGYCLFAACLAIGTTGCVNPRWPVARTFPSVPPTRVESVEAEGTIPPVRLASAVVDVTDENDDTKESTPKSESSKDSRNGTASDPKSNLDLDIDSAESEPIVMSSAECVSTAITSHPKISAARSRVKAAQHRVPQAWALEDPKLSTRFWPIQPTTLQTVGGRMQNEMGLSQNIPWPEKRDARAAIACQEVQIALAELASVELDIAESVQLAYYELWFAERSTVLLAQNRKRVDEIIRVAEAKYKTGGSQQDILNAEVEREQLDQQRLQNESQKAAANAELASYLLRPRELTISTLADLPNDAISQKLDVLIAIAEKSNPELNGLSRAIQRDSEKRRLADLQRYPDFELGTQYGFMTRDGATDPLADGIDMISFSVGVTLPVYRKKIAGGIGEAHAEQVNSFELKQSEQLTLEAKLRRLAAETESLDRQKRILEDRIIPRVEQSLKIGLTEYVVGKATFVQLAETRQRLLMSALQLAKIESEIAKTVVQIERLTGSWLAMDRLN